VPYPPYLCQIRAILPIIIPTSRNVAPVYELYGLTEGEEEEEVRAAESS
jgi:hypothetical protein